MVTVSPFCPWLLMARKHDDVTAKLAFDLEHINFVTSFYPVRTLSDNFQQEPPCPITF